MTTKVEGFSLTTTREPGFGLGRLVFAFVVTLLAIGAFLGAFAVGYAKLNQDRLMPGVTVAGVDVAGLDRSAAEARLRASLPDLRTGSLTVNVGGQTETIKYSLIDRDYDINYMLEQAIRLGRNGTPLEQLREQVGLLQNGAAVPAVMSWNNDALTRNVVALAESAQVAPVDATITRVNGDYVVLPSSPGTSIDVGQVVSQAMAAVNGFSADSTTVDVPGTEVLPQVATDVPQRAVDQAQAVVRDGLTVAGEDLSTTIDPATLRGWVHLDATAPGQWALTIEQGPITQYVTDYGTATDKPATNATFKLDPSNNHLSVVPSAEGRAIDVQATAAAVYNSLAMRARGQSATTAGISFVPVEPTLTTAQAQAIAPRVTKLSEWTTHYIPSPSLNGNGVNIQIPTSILDGYVVDAGATFDFLDAIGPITSPPYEAGGALVHGLIVENGPIGGGMCSVSTTLFNAALRYGLPMTARINHSLYISRYPIGLDATVWETGPKNRHTMAFVNDTGYPLVIRGINSPGAVTFELWGVDDGRTVQLSEPTIQNLKAPDYASLTYVDTLPPGTRRKTFDAYEAFDAYVTRTVRNAAGQITIQETYHSAYRMLGAEFNVGRGPGDPAVGKTVQVPADATTWPPVSTATGQR